MVEVHADSAVEASEFPLTLRLRPRLLMLALVGTFIGLLLAHAAVVSSYLHDWRFPGRDRFFFDHENNLPTFFSTLILLMAAVLLALISRAKLRDGDGFVRHWQWMAVIFLGLAVDEAASFHELLIQPLRVAFGLGGVFWFGWVLAGAPFVAGFAVAYLGFLRHLPGAEQRLFVAAGALYVGGALGLEMLGARLFLAGEATQELGPYMLVMTLEESLEMAGILLFNHALLIHLRRCCGRAGAEVVRLPVPTRPAGRRWTRHAPVAGRHGGSAAA